MVGNAAGSSSNSRHAMFPCLRICVLSSKYRFRFSGLRLFSWGMSAEKVMDHYNKLAYIFLVDLNDGCLLPL